MFLTFQYELLHFYLNAVSRTDYDENDLQVFCVTSAIQYFRRTFELDLKINQNFDVTRLGAGKKENMGAGGPLASNDNCSTDEQGIVELLGGASVVFIPVSSKRNPIVRIINKKLIVKNQEQYQCKMNCKSACNCASQSLIRDKFLGSKIYVHSMPKQHTFDCILCDCEVKRNALDKHFDYSCVVFKVSQIIHDKLNV